MKYVSSCAPVMLMLGVFVLATPHQALSAEANERTSNNVPRFLTGRLPVADANVPQHWSATENVAWSTDLPGLGWSSPVVWGDRIFVTTCVNTGEGRSPRKGLYLEDLDATKYKTEDKHLWKVYCLDLNSGEIVWEDLAHEGIPPKPYHIKNTLASETATTDGQRVYARFGNCGLFCYDMDGNLLWKKLDTPRDTHYGWGTSQSPIVHDGRVYLVNDNQEESFLSALDASTGEEIWRVERDEKTNYSTPYIWENDQRTELVISAIGYARSYDLDGNLLWQLKGKSILAIPTPQEHDGLLHLTSGHVVWGENPMYAIRPGASGDITLGEDETSSEYIAWYQPDAGPYHPTPLIVDDQMYVLLDRGFMTSYSPETGEEIYSKRRIPKGRAFTCSPWSDGKNLYCINEDGVTFAIKLGPDFEVLYTNELQEDDMCMATPVIVGDRLLIRTAARMYCIQNSGETTQAAD